MPAFYLGTCQAHWLGLTDVPLFVSHRTLAPRKSFPRALGPWALDSGGFTELNTPPYRWVTSPQEYVTAVRRYATEVGNLVWASPQDWMNEPAVLANTGLTVAEHQQLTVTNYLTLRELAPDLPFIPVLQGWERADYLRCADLYEHAGVNLTAEPVVGVGTVCRRSDTASASAIVAPLADRGYRLHGFGVKLTGLQQYGAALTSSDSMAWSYDARRLSARCRRYGRVNPCPDGRGTCSNCLHYALAWRSKALRAAQAGAWQAELAL